MILTGDYHTHTIYSHGKGGVIDNVKVAFEKGIKEIAITDHGFSHPAFGLKRKKMPSLIEDIHNARKSFDVKVYLGIESNLISNDGEIDIKEDKYKDFDLIAVGIHRFVLYRAKAFFSIFIPNVFTDFLRFKPSKGLIKRNTKAFVGAVKNNPIDIITHLNYGCFADAREVAKVCADYGTFLEISGKKTHFTKEEFYNISKEKVNFVLNSDAHSPERVGDVALAKELIKDGIISEDRIVNINGKTPDFRFRRYKLEKGIY